MMESIRGQQTVQKIVLYVEGTKWGKSSRVLDSMAAVIKTEDGEFADAEGWTVVEKPSGGIRFKDYYV